MKKLILIVLTGAVLAGFSIYTVNKYNSSNSKNEISQEKESTNDSTNTEKSSNNESKNSINVKPNTIKTKAIDFKLKDLDGNEISLSSLKGKKIFLNFWATWCPPCKEEMPEIEKLYQETKNSDLVILAVDLGESPNTVKSFIKERNYNFNVLLDTDQSVASKYNIVSIPTSFFIDADGNIVSTKNGSMNIDEMKAYIKTLDK